MKSWILQKVLVLIVALLLSVLIINPVRAQDGLGGSFGGDGSGGDKSAYDGSNGGDGQSFQNDFSGGDFNGTDTSFSDYSNTYSGDSNSSFESFVSEMFGLGNEAGVSQDAMGLGSLSNQNTTLDQSGAVVAVDSVDPGYSCQTVNCNEPILSGTVSCLANQPYIDLSWTGDPTNTRYWHIVKAHEPNPTFSQLTLMGFNLYNFRDLALEPNKVYYYSVFGSNSGNGVSYSARTPLSNILAVYSPACAPVVTPVCVNTNPGTIQDFSVSWLNNNPAVSGYKLYRGINGNISTRTFLPPNHSPQTNNYLDTAVIEGTSYNYWYKSYQTVYHPAYQEVTSTDENGNPTGFQDYPAYYEDVESPFSGMSKAEVVQSCQPSQPSVPVVTPAPVTTPAPIITPSVNLTITTPQGTYPSNSLPVVVRQNDPVSLNWQITNATDATASANPGLSSWNGPVNPVFGSKTISTNDVGTYLLTLTGANGVNTSAATLQLVINPSFVPFIQTTQGDVHSNSNIQVPD